MTVFDPATIIDTGGWDMVVGLPLTMINAALGVQNLDLSFSFTAPNAGQTIALSGTFAPWSIVGGSGQDLVLMVPIASGSASVTGSGSGPAAVPVGDYDLTGVNVTLGTRLVFEQNAGSPSVSRLVFAFDAATSQAPGATGAPTGELATGGGDIPSLLRDALPSAIGLCLAANIEKMNLVFATLTADMDMAGGGAAPDPQWQYAIASQQAGTSQAVAIFYAAAPGGSLSSSIPAPIGTNDTECIVLLSQEAALRSAVIPILVYALDHVRAPMSEGMGVGPAIVEAPPATNDIDPAVFSVTLGAAGTNTATVAATQPIVLALGGWSGGATATLTDFSCAVTGSDLSISLTASSPIDGNTPYALSRNYRLAVGQHWNYGTQSFGVFLLPTESTGPENNVQHMIFGALDQGLSAASLPFTFRLFDQQTMQPQEGYLNGGLGLAGPVASASS